MKGHQKTYSFFTQLSAVFLIGALLWLTVSLPFVYETQKKFAAENTSANSNCAHSGCDEEAGPFGNTTEEKAPGNTTVSEEYLHDNHISEYIMGINSRNHKCENSSIYTAFHGEVQVPPPNIS
jgi:hypothetical protein